MSSFIKVTFLIITILVVFLLSLFLLGENQILTPHFVLKRLSRGMTVQQVNHHLGVGEICRLRQSREISESRKRCVVSYIGVGSWVYPQHSLILYFDDNDTLNSYAANWRFQMDEQVESGDFLYPKDLEIRKRS